MPEPDETQSASFTPAPTPADPTPAPKAEKAAPAPKEPEVKTKLIHFVRDGFTAFGTIWYTGQELEIQIPSHDYTVTLDANGKSWLDESEQDQYDIRGDVYWREGPWRGQRDEAFEAAEAARRRRAPRVPV
jgi:hypothetical protein